MDKPFTTSTVTYKLQHRQAASAGVTVNTSSINGIVEEIMG
jgi:hypothetical protein